MYVSRYMNPCKTKFSQNGSVILVFFSESRILVSFFLLPAISSDSCLSSKSQLIQSIFLPTRKFQKHQLRLSIMLTFLKTGVINVISPPPRTLTLHIFSQTNGLCWFNKHFNSVYICLLLNFLL